MLKVTCVLRSIEVHPFLCIATNVAGRFGWRACARTHTQTHKHTHTQPVRLDTHTQPVRLNTHTHNLCDCTHTQPSRSDTPGAQLQNVFANSFFFVFRISFLHLRICCPTRTAQRNANTHPKRISANTKLRFLTNLAQNARNCVLSVGML